MPHFPSFLPPLFFGMQTVAFTIFAPYLLLRFYKFPTYLQRANVCKSVFFFRQVSYLRVDYYKSYKLLINLRLTS